jgi:hypothetical protein
VIFRLLQNEALSSSLAEKGVLHTGYSQSMSRPPKLYVYIKFCSYVVNACLLAADETTLLKAFRVLATSVDRWKSQD